MAFPSTGDQHQDKIPDTEVLDQAGLPSVHDILMLSQLRWAGPVARMPDHWLPKRLFYSELQEGKGQKKRLKDTPKTSLKAFHINPDTWGQIAMDRARWRYSLHKGASLCEERRTAAAPRKETGKESPAAASKTRSPTLPSKLSPHIPCTHRLDQSPAFPQIISSPACSWPVFTAWFSAGCGSRQNGVVPHGTNVMISREEAHDHHRGGTEEGLSGVDGRVRPGGPAGGSPFHHCPPP